MPLPMMPPTTSSTADQNPSSLRSPVPSVPSSRVPPSDDNQLPLDVLRRDDEFPRGDVSVHLGAHAELAGKVDARFDREPGALDERALVSRLEVVEVGPGTVQVPAVDRVAGPMGELRAEAGGLDDTSRRVVRFSPAHR